MIRAFLVDLLKSIRDAIAYVLATAFIGVLYVPPEWMP